MLRSSQTYLAPDDVSIPCRIRHSETTTPTSLSSDNNQQSLSFTETQDVMCTMRVWRKIKGDPSSNVNHHSPVPLSTSTSSPFPKAGATSSSSLMKIPSTTAQALQAGPEVILTPVHNSLIDHHHQRNNHLCCVNEFGGPANGQFLSHSFGMKSPQERYSITNNDNNINNNIIDLDKQERPRRIGTVTIPVNDIMLMDANDNTNSNKKKSKKSSSCYYQINITTKSLGYFEFMMENSNGQLMLMAFLKANLSKDKIAAAIMQASGGIPKSPSNITQNASSCGSTTTFDVEAFTARRMTERLQSESVSEKLQRRIYRIVSSLEEMSGNIADCSSCGCGGKNAAISPAPQHRGGEKRDSPPPRLSDAVELSTEYTPVSGRSNIDPLGGTSNRRSTLSNRFEMRPSSNYYKKQELLRATHMPSGLSVESDPEMETSTVAAVATTIAEDP